MLSFSLYRLTSLGQVTLKIYFFFTISIFSFSIVKSVVLSEIFFDFSVLVFTLKFLQATCSYSVANFSHSKTAASRVVSSAHLAKKFKSSSSVTRSCKYFISSIRESRMRLNKVGESR